MNSNYKTNQLVPEKTGRRVPNMGDRFPIYKKGPDEIWRFIGWATSPLPKGGEYQTFTARELSAGEIKDEPADPNKPSAQDRT